MRSNQNGTTRRWLWGAAWAALAVAAPLAPTGALAQTAASAQAARAYDIPAGPLAAALNRFAEQSGLALVYPASLTAGLRTSGLSGTSSVQDALARLLAGTNLSFRFLDAKTITLEPPPVAGARTLGAVQVEGVQNEGFAALNGFGAGAGSNGSSDPTATEGTGSFTTNGATVASKAPQSLKDTPQSVTVITQERILQQNLTDLTSALEYTPGVTLEDGSSVETVFFSRGFQITSFQIDGGAPLDLSTNSFYLTTPNLAEYDNVQVLRGSDALFGGAGQPGGVVSLDRKRPLDHEQFLGEFDAGSWNNYLVQADVTGPIAFDGHVRARLVVNDQDRDFFYETAHQNKAFVYGVIEGDLDPNTILRAGFSYEQQTNPAFDYNGLPRYSDGGDIDLPRSTSLTPAWNQWNFTTPEFFAALEHKFNPDWNLKLNFTRLQQNSVSKIGENYGSIYRNEPSQSDYAESDIFNEKFQSIQYSIDAVLNGDFEFFGLKQNVTIGTDYSEIINNLRYEVYLLSIPINVFSFNPSQLSYYTTNYQINGYYPLYNQKQWGGYATLNLQPLANFHLIGGVRLSNYWYISISDAYVGSEQYPGLTKNDVSGVLTPYAAATYGLTPDITLYASYADIFQAQGDDLDQFGKPLPPITGVTYEIGIKGAFNDNKLNASLSVYYTDESNQAIPYSGDCLHALYCYENGGAVISSGLDLEVTGQLLPGWQIQGGYTYNVNRYNKASLPVSGNGFNSTYQTQQPNHQIKLWTAYTPTGRFNQWTIGGGLRLESARSAVGTICSVPTDYSGYCADGTTNYAFTQGLYAVVDLRVAYKVNDHWQAALNLTNIGDTRYYATVGTNQAGNYYGEPRAFMFSLRAAY